MEPIKTTKKTEAAAASESAEKLASEVENPDSTNPKMALWNRNYKTDVAHLRATGQPFLDIVHQETLRRATREWGGYGAAWGLTELEWEYISDEKGPFMLQLNAKFHYPSPLTPDSDQMAVFPVADSLIFRVGDGEYLPYIHKSLITSIIGKTLSKLGFHGDVYAGEHDHLITPGEAPAGGQAKKPMPADKFNEYLLQAQVGKVSVWIEMAETYSLTADQKKQLKIAFVKWAKSVTTKTKPDA